jgi:chromate transporter
MVRHQAQLAWIFVRIGAAAFGGLGATLALLEEELVRHRKLLSSESIADSLTYTKLLPGSTAVQVVGFLGWRLGGWPGSAVCTAAFLAPSVLAMLALAYGYSYVTAVPAAAAVRRGVLAAVVGLLLLTLFRMAQAILDKPLAIALALAAFAVGSGLQANAVWIVVAAGVIGVLSRRR